MIECEPCFVILARWIEDLKISYQAQREDRAFFTNNPSRSYRVRPAFMNEVDSDLLAGEQLFIAARRNGHKIERRPCFQQACPTDSEEAGRLLWSYWEESMTDVHPAFLEGADFIHGVWSGSMRWSLPPQ